MTRLILVVLAALAAASAAPATAQCGPRAAVLALLADRFGETRRGYGTAGLQALIALCASSETGSFTVTVTRPDGLTCVIAAGAGWEMLILGPPARGDPA